MSKIKLDTLPKMQSSIKDIVKFRGASSSTTYNGLQESMFFDISNMFNIISEYENRLQETSTLQSIDNLYTQMKLGEYELENLRLRMELEKYMYNYQKKCFLDVFNAFTVDVNTSPTINKMFNQINVANHSVTSKLYLYDEALDLITIPSSLTYEITPAADNISIIDNEFTNAFNGNMNEYYVRRIVSDDTTPKEMEIIIELPDNIISSRDINSIEISPFPYASVDIVDVLYQLNGNWVQVPGFTSHQCYDSDVSLNEYGDLIDIGAIKNAENIKLCFNKTAMAKVKIKLRQSTYTVENNRFTFYMGIKYLNINCENVIGNYCEFYSDIVLPEESPKLITKIVPYFNNNDILSDQTDEKKSLMSYELYSVDEDGSREYIKNSFPVVCHNNRYMLVTKMYYDRSADVNPSLARLDVVYDLTESAEDDRCTCVIKDIELGIDALTIPYDQDANISLLNATSNFITTECPIESHNNAIQPAYSYKIKATDATASIKNGKLISNDSGNIIITVEAYYNGKRAQRDFEIVATKEESPLFTLTYLASDGGTILGQSEQQVSWKADGNPVEAVGNERSKFVAWDDGVKTLQRRDTDIRANLTVKALFETKKYTVTFMAYKDAPVLEAIKTIQVPHGQAATPPVVQDIGGYRFKAWDIEFSQVTSGLIVNATYVKLYTVTFVDYDGRVIYNQYVEKDASAIAPTTPVRAGHTFINWDKDYDIITGDTVVTALYTINSYSVTFKDYDGSLLKSEKVNYKSSATPPLVTSKRDGYEHTGWDKSYTGIIKDAVITATYKIKKYKVDYKLEDGTTIDSQTVSHGSTSTPPDVPTQVGKTFLGWYENSNKITDFSNIEANRTFTAMYDTTKYSITMPTVSGVTFSPAGVIEVAYGGDLAFTFTIDAGYELDGMTLNGKPIILSGNSYTIKNVKGTVLIEAALHIKTYTVKWLNHDGSELRSDTVNHGANLTPPNVPDRPNYTFTGWDKTYNNITKDMTITAQFSIYTYTVKWLNYDGAEIRVDTVPHGSTLTPPTVPNRPNHSFTGWDKTYSNVTEDMTITAQFIVISHTVKFIDYDGRTIATKTVNTGDTVTPPSDPTRTGYNFTGWIEE